MDKIQITEEKIFSILADQLRIKRGDIALSLQFGDIPQWDSLGHMSIIAALEEEFNIEVDVDLIAELTSVRAIIAFLEEQIHG